LVFSIIAMIIMAFFVKMSNGATYSVVPFINKNAMGAVSGIVGAGGNAGAVMAGFVLKAEGVSYREGLFVIGIVVAVVSTMALLIKFPAEKQVTSEQPIDSMIPSEKIAGVPELVEE
jgi:MFS transporter, NNP family, nitrate/nitrite transporter